MLLFCLFYGGESLEGITWIIHKMYWIKNDMFNKKARRSSDFLTKGTRPGWDIQGDFVHGKMWLGGWFLCPWGQIWHSATKSFIQLNDCTWQPYRKEHKKEEFQLLNQYSKSPTAGLADWIEIRHVNNLDSWCKVTVSVSLPSFKTDCIASKHSILAVPGRESP